MRKLYTYTECRYCGKKKNATTTTYCSNDCRHLGEAFHKDIQERATKLIIDEGRSLLKKPLFHHDFLHKICNKLRIEKTSGNLIIVGSTLNQLTRQGYINCCPSINNSHGVFYLRGDEIVANDMYSKYFTNLPIKTQQIIMATKYKHLKRAKAATQLFEQGKTVTEIAKKLKITKISAKRMIGETNG